MKECEFPMIDRSLTMAQRAWRGKHPDWISDHFYMGEFIYSAVAVERGLDNTPPPEAQKAIKTWLLNYWSHSGTRRCCYRDAISSGYRSDELNRLVGGVENSQHSDR